MKNTIANAGMLLAFAGFAVALTMAVSAIVLFALPGLLVIGAFVLAGRRWVATRG